jgi:hypothetical protein
MAVMANTTMANATIANTTQFMTPEMLSKFVLQSWLVPKAQGENCASHSRIYGMLIVYNVVAVMVSLLMARPWYIEQQEAIQSSISRSFSKFFRRLLCLPEPQETTTSPTSIQRLFLAVLGFAIITMAGPLLSSLSIYLSHRDSVTFANMLAEWSTRPRATWLVFLTNYIASRAGDREESERGHIVAAATTYIGEVIVSLFGVTLLRDQSRMPYPWSDPSVDCSAVKCPNLAADAGMLRVFIYCNVGFNSLLVVHWLITRDSKFYIGATMVFTWLMTIFSWVGSILVWKDLLDSTPVELYCIEESTSIDLIYCLLPVALGLWRAACVTSTR